MCKCVCICLCVQLCGSTYVCPRARVCVCELYFCVVSIYWLCVSCTLSHAMLCPTGIHGNTNTTTTQNSFYITTLALPQCCHTTSVPLCFNNLPLENYIPTLVPTCILHNVNLMYTPPYTLAYLHDLVLRTVRPKLLTEHSPPGHQG